MTGQAKTSGVLEFILAAALMTGAFGSVLGLEKNIQPSDRKIEDTSFKAYLEQGKKQYGGGIGTYVAAVWTYPGARLGAEIHNSGLPENSEK